MHIQHTHLQSGVSRCHLGSLHGLIHAGTAGNHGNICALVHYLGLAHLKGALLQLGINDLVKSAVDTNINRAGIAVRCLNRVISLCAVARADHGHVGQRAHARHIDQSMVGRARLTE